MEEPVTEGRGERGGGRLGRACAGPRHHVRVPASLGLGHDVMDPVQKGQHTDLAYPVLLDLVTGT
jgi:hypothetical protein